MELRSVMGENNALEIAQRDANLLAEMDFEIGQGAAYDLDVATYNRITARGDVLALKLAKLADQGLITVGGRKLNDDS